MAQLLDRSGARGRFRPSPVVPLPEQIRRQLVEAVAMGELRPGDRLPGVRIAQPKPDLLQQTLHDGLSVLADLSGVTMGNLAEARRESETACVRAASRRRTEDDLRAMRDALDRSADEQLEISEWLGLDIVFHRGVANASHNPILAMPLTAVHAVSQPLGLVSRSVG